MSIGGADYLASFLYRLEATTARHMLLLAGLVPKSCGGKDSYHSPAFVRALQQTSDDEVAAFTRCTNGAAQAP